MSRLPETDGEPQKFLVWDSDDSRLGYFDGPVAVANWAPYKAEGDDLTLVGSRLNSFIQTLTSTKIPGVVLPGTYRVDQILDLASDTVLRLHGAALHQYNTALGSGTAANGQSLIRITDASNVVIEGGALNGRKASIDGSSEFKHGIEIRGDCQNITIRDVITTANKGDGVFIGHWTDSVPYAVPRDITLERVVSSGNHRQGMSIEHGRNISAVDCVFENTSGTPPTAGVDIEPSTVNDEATGISFDRCVFRGNDGYGVLIHPGPLGTRTVPRKGITFDTCQFIDNLGIGLQASGMDDITLRDCIIERNETRGISVQQVNYDMSGIKVLGGCIRDNGTDGIAVYAGSGLTVSDIIIDGVTITGNSAASSGTNSGINLGTFSSNAIARVTITGGTQLGHPTATETQFAGLRLGGDHVTGVIIDDVRFGDTTGGNALSGYSAARVSHIARTTGVVVRNAGVTSVANGGTISHGLTAGSTGFTPTKYGVTATAADRRIAVTAVGSSTLTISLTDGAGTAIATPESVAWWAEV